jgi:hypothetical protein
VLYSSHETYEAKRRMKKKKKKKKKTPCYSQ